MLRVLTRHPTFVNWTQGSINRKIFNVAFIVAMITIAIKLFGFAKNLVTAHFFGVSHELDAFYMAWLLPNLAISLIGTTLSHSTIPVYMQAKEQQKQDVANKLAGNVVAFGGLSLVAAAVLIACVSPWVLPLVGSSFDPATLRLAQMLSYILLIGMVCKGVATIWAGLLNSQHRYTLATVAQGIVPIVTVVFLLIVGTSLGVYVLAIAMATGFFLEAVLLAWQLRHFGLPAFPRWTGIDASFRQVLGQFRAGLAVVFMAVSARFVDQAMAGSVGPGSIATLNYALTLVEPIMLIATQALGTAFLPYFSQMIARNNWRGLRHTLMTYTWIVLLCSVPLTILMFVFSETIVSVIFQRGAFSAQDAYQVAQVQAMYVLQIPFFILTAMLGRCLAAMKRNELFLTLSIISVVNNVVFNIIFTYLFGLKGIALSTAMVYLFSYIFLHFMVRRQIRRGEQTCA